MMYVRNKKIRVLTACLQTCTNVAYRHNKFAVLFHIKICDSLKPLFTVPWVMHHTCHG